MEMMRVGEGIKGGEDEVGVRYFQSKVYRLKLHEKTREENWTPLLDDAGVPLYPVGLDYGHAGQMTLDEITGGSPYGATTITGGDGSRLRPANELQGARFA